MVRQMSSRIKYDKQVQLFRVLKKHLSANVIYEQRYYNTMIIPLDSIALILKGDCLTKAFLHIGQEIEGNKLRRCWKT